MGELHLDIMVDRLRREYGVEANVGRPQVVYRETLAKAGEGEARFERTLDDESLFGHARVRVAPRPRGSGNQLRMELVRSAEPVPGRAKIPDAPPAILEAAMEGAREAMRSGPQGYPFEDIEVVITGIEYRPDASTPAGQKAAVGEALRQASRDAGTRLLEPIMRIEVTAPEQNVGDVLGDLNARRAQIQDVGFRGNLRVILAKVPLRRMFGYSTDLRSATQGRANYSMQFDTYDAWEWLRLNPFARIGWTLVRAPREPFALAPRSAAGRGWGRGAPAADLTPPLSRRRERANNQRAYQLCLHLCLRAAPQQRSRSPILSPLPSAGEVGASARRVRSGRRNLTHPHWPWHRERRRAFKHGTEQQEDTAPVGGDDALVGEEGGDVGGGQEEAGLAGGDLGPQEGLLGGVLGGGRLRQDLPAARIDHAPVLPGELHQTLAIPRRRSRPAASTSTV